MNSKIIKKLEKEIKELEDKYPQESSVLPATLVPTPFWATERLQDLRNERTRLKIEEIMHSKQT